MASLGAWGKLANVPFVRAVFQTRCRGVRTSQQFPHNCMQLQLQWATLHGCQCQLHPFPPAPFPPCTPQNGLRVSKLRGAALLLCACLDCAQGWPCLEGWPCDTSITGGPAHTCQLSRSPTIRGFDPLCPHDCHFVSISNQSSSHMRLKPTLSSHQCFQEVRLNLGKTDI